MQNVKIPEDNKPWFECSINGKNYKYPAGATVSVPDDVAALIANINASRPKHVTPTPTQEIKKPTAANKVLKSVAKDGGYEYEEGEDAGSILPAVTSTDNGKVLKVVSGAWDKGDAPTGLPTVTASDNGAFLGVSEGAWGKVDNPCTMAEVHGEIGTLQDKTIITLSITAAQLAAMCSNGKLLKLDFALSESITVTCCLPVICLTTDNDGSVSYVFRVDTDKTYRTTSLGANDSVVFIEV